MSEFDAKVAWFLKQVFIPVCTLLLIACYIWKNYKTLRQVVFARWYMRFSGSYLRALDDSRKALFRELDDLTSLDWDARNRGHIRILELGVGPGSNFKFYPKNARVVAVEPNTNFRESLLRNCEKFPHVVLESVVADEGENMISVADDSVDVVITTSVLCSVRDVDKVLSEVHRVLAPGGKYFFIEHVSGDTGTWCHTVQHALQPVCHFLLDCNLNREIGVSIVEAGFAEVRLKSFEAPLGMAMRLAVGPHIFGTAQK